MTFAVRLAGLYAAIFILNGMQLPFLSLWLAAKGLDAREIGIVLAVPMLVRLLAVPPVTRMADRRDILREAILGTTLLSVVGYVLVAFSGSFITIAVAFALASFAYTPAMPLVETYALRGLAGGRNYGPVRLWGSAAFIVGALIAGVASNHIAARDLIWLLVVASVLVAISGAMLAPLNHVQHLHSARAPVRLLLRDPIFIAVIVGAGLIQASHSTFYGFSILAWRADGYDGTTIAAFWGIGVIAEILLFAGQSRLPAFVTPTMLLLIGAGGGVLRWTVMAFDPPTFVLPFLQALHGATFGATHLGSMMYLARTVPVGLGATAQGFFSITVGLSMAAATALAGVLYARFGVASYAAMSVAAFAGGAGAFIAHRSRRVTAL